MLERTLRVLEYTKIIDKLESYATSMIGKELVRELLPFTDPVRIEEGLQVTSEAAQILIQAERPPLGGIFDIRPQLKKASINGVLAPEELLQVAATLRA
ncbi:MAG TPA: endonuclease MutS2, partial [Firmicutes bacterium]|nr:endonuclease MutS2 [Bacillota bacterium]